MNRQNNFLTRTRRCSCCRNEGHNITYCNDPTLLNFRTNLTNRRNELREIHSIDIGEKIAYFETWLYGQDRHLIKSYAIRFCGAYTHNNLQFCVQKIISLLWNVQLNIFGWQSQTYGIIHDYTSLPAAVSIMDIPDDSLNYLDLRLAEILAGLRNNHQVNDENTKFKINTILCVEVEELETENDCNICYEKTKNQNMVTLNCKHKFCGDCVSQTLKKCNKFTLPNCAMCRTKIDCILVNSNEVLNTLKENIV